MTHEALIVSDADDQVVHVDFAVPGSSPELALRQLVGEAPQ